MDSQSTEIRTNSQFLRTVKCVVWDLDHTIWHGILLEDEQVQLRVGISTIIKTLDERGILHSIASKNDYEKAKLKLQEMGLWEYFLFPQINWNSKVSSLREIASLLNISLDALAFVDDQLFEQEEIAYSLPEILCIDSALLDHMLSMPSLSPASISEEAVQRRQLYLSDMRRKQAEKEFVGTSEDFLATLGMEFSLATAGEEDLQRAEELTNRTHQLNSTGYTYSYNELLSFLRSDRHKLLIASLEDKYGIYGKIGLVLIKCDPQIWTIKLLLMSCRVMSRGVGTIMISYIMQMAQKAGVLLRAEFVSTERNRLMYITYKFAGFRQVKKEGDVDILENDLSHIQSIPSYVRVSIQADDDL